MISRHARFTQTLNRLIKIAMTETDVANLLQAHHCRVDDTTIENISDNNGVSMRGK
jgi:hypothetical protein